MKLSAALSSEPWKSRFRETGRVSIPGLLDAESAGQLAQALATQQQWNLVFKQQGAHVDINADAPANWDREQTDEFFRIVHQGAEQDFQYLYKTVPIYDVFHRDLLPGHFFNDLFRFLNGEEFLGYVRQVLDAPEIGFADAQATCYEAGHFLTSHDDAVSGKNRVAAYVINMTPDWRADWGGALQFTDDQQGIVDSFAPAFNTLNMFKVPQPHAVSYVAPFAREKRLSITGWLRVGDDPGP